MAVKKNDPYATRADADADLIRRRPAQIDNELQPDPELAEGPASGGRIALFAIAVIAILGVVFYGLNNPSITPQPESTAQTTTSAPSTTATAPTPAPGQTTGTATTSPSTTPSTTPSMTPAPSPSNGGTTQSGPPANN